MAHKKTNYLFNFFFFLCISLLIIVLLLVFFIRGPFIKKPIEALFSQYLNERVTIGEVKYSPLYPNIIALYNIHTESGINIQEIYAEGDIQETLENPDVLKLTELDIIHPRFEKKISTNFIEKLPKIHTQKLWIKNFEFNDGGNLSLASENFTLKNNLQDSLLNSFGRIELTNVQIKDIQLLDSHMNYKCDNVICNLDYLFTSTTGIIKGKADLNLKNKSVITNNLEISGLALYLNKQLDLYGYKLNIPSISASDIFISDNNIKINSFSGTIKQTNHDNFLLDGSYSALSTGYISLGVGSITSLLNNDQSINYLFNAEFSDGYINANVKINADSIEFKTLALNGISLDIKNEDISKIFSLNKNLSITDMSCANCEIISFINDWPLSLKHSNLHLNHLSIPIAALDNLIIGNFEINDGAISLRDYSFVNSNFNGWYRDNVIHLFSSNLNTNNSQGKLALEWPVKETGEYHLKYDSDKTNSGDIKLPIFNQINGDFAVNLSIDGERNNISKLKIKGKLSSPIFTIDNFSFYQFRNKLTDSIDCNTLVNSYYESLSSIDEITNFNLDFNFNNDTIYLNSIGQALSGSFQTEADYNIKNKALIGEINITNSTDSTNGKIVLSGECK